MILQIIFFTLLLGLLALAYFIGKQIHAILNGERTVFKSIGDFFFSNEDRRLSILSYEKDHYYTTWVIAHQTDQYVCFFRSFVLQFDNEEQPLIAQMQYDLRIWHLSLEEQSKRRGIPRCTLEIYGNVKDELKFGQGESGTLCPITQTEFLNNDTVCVLPCGHIASIELKKCHPLQCPICRKKCNPPKIGK
jgi:hypothetical protein